ncbi:hypothetical protein COT72_03760 [archaeon CG10_big_fil_rev_8_21_14_0_10_43_11]|nr:MAG: hypothetical protein COT72_03760 [archaeon CG10_big_fil_rev_8_21_14_0_10_43_11]
MGQVPVKQGDLLLVPFPFSDQSGRKVRPVIVVSNNSFNKTQDVIVVGVTSNLDGGDIIINPVDVEQGNLYDECCVKVSNILKLDKRLVIKRIGRIKAGLLREIITRIHKILC